MLSCYALLHLLILLISCIGKNQVVGFRSICFRHLASRFSCATLSVKDTDTESCSFEQNRETSNSTVNRMVMSIETGQSPKNGTKRNDSSLTRSSLLLDKSLSSSPSMQKSLFDDDAEDIDLVEETVLDKSIAKAVKQLIDDGLSEPEATPLEIFNTLCQNMTHGRNGSSAAPSLSGEEMFHKIFRDEDAKDPFDEKKVMFKLRNMLDAEDFDALFKDPSIGDWL